MVAAILNGVLNALIAWGTAASEDEIPLWAVPLVEGPSTITDTVATLFILPFLTTLADHDVRLARDAGGTSSRRSWSTATRTRCSRACPPRRARRGAYFGVLTMVLLGPVAVVLLVAFDFGDISVGDFVALQGDLRRAARRVGDAADRAAAADRTGRRRRQRRRKWRGPESNRGHRDFQSRALPTELPRRAMVTAQPWNSAFAVRNRLRDDPGRDARSQASSTGSGSIGTPPSCQGPFQISKCRWGRTSCRCCPRSRASGRCARGRRASPARCRAGGA